jgi:hypothetical protein
MIILLTKTAGILKYYILSLEEQLVLNKNIIVKRVINEYNCRLWYGKSWLNY